MRIFLNIVLHYVWQMVTTRSGFLLKMHKKVFGDLAVPQPTGGTYSTLPD